MDKIYWLGKEGKPSFDNYSRISTCLALSKVVYTHDADACVATLNELKDSMQHGINQVLFSVNCKRQYLIAFKGRTKEIYVAFRGTESWKALLISFQVYAKPNDLQDTFHSGYYQQAQLIPLAPFCHLLNKYKDYKLIFTGHSLGGAIAAIVTINMLTDLRTIEFQERIHCVTFGAPFIGNEACSKYIDERSRRNFQFYVNHTDFIPYLLTFFYNQSSELLSKELLKKCSEWLQALALSLIAGEVPTGIFSRLVRRFGAKRWTTQADCESECLGLSKYLIEICRDALIQMLSAYRPFGLCYRTKFVSANVGTDKKMFIDTLSIEEVCKKENLWGHQTLCAIQDHFIKNYITEIYTNVITKNAIVPRRECPSVRLVKHHFDFSASPLSIFLPSDKKSWKWKDPSDKNENEKSTYTWSVVSSRCEDKEEITLRIYGPAVSLIIGLKCENSMYAETPLKPEDNYDESIRLFILYLPYRENRRAEDYPFYIISHFDIVNLTGLFEPKMFTLSNGMQGRKKQIADLNVLELYKLAFAYCTFTGDEVLGSNSLDSDRRKSIEKYLFLTENILEKDCKILEKEYLNHLPGEQLRKLMKEISYAKSDSNNYQTSSTASPYESDDESDGIVECLTSMISRNAEGKNTLLPNVKFSDIKTVMRNWRTIASAKRLQSLATIDSSEYIGSTTEAVVHAIPRLFCMNISLTRDFALKFDVRDVRWKQSGVATIGGRVLGFLGSFVFFSRLLSCLLATAESTTFFGGIKAIAECLRSVHIEYLKILVFIAKSLGVVMDQVRMHQYSLEERISSIYCKTLKILPSEEHMYDEWTNIFPGGILNMLQNREKQNHCLSIIKCIDANFQMRTLLSQDFALGVVGPGKSGKSTLLRSMFGFDTNPDKEIQTTDLRSYRVTDQFRVVDFPHMTSVFDSVRNCFICNHALVNAVIVVLNAEQGGNDKDGEGYVVAKMKELAKKGVDVLYCFNQCDKLALKNRCAQNRGKSDKFSMYKSGKIQQSNASVGNEVLEYWTEEHVESKREEWAKNYKLDLDKCWMTFCELEEMDEMKCLENFRRLETMQLCTYLDIKTKWLREVLKRNSVSEKSIEEIMNFRYETEQ